MTPAAYRGFDKLTSDRTLPVINALLVRREELRKLLVSVRDAQELVRIQGRAEEVDTLLTALQQ